MIALVSRIFRAEGTAEEADADVELFIANCKHPAKSDLIFWPHGFPNDPTQLEPTIEKVVDRAMNGD